MQLSPRSAGSAANCLSRRCACVGARLLGGLAFILARQWSALSSVVGSMSSSTLTAVSAAASVSAASAHTQHNHIFCIITNRCTHTHPFNGPLSGTTRVSRYQKGKTNLNFTEARDSEWQWHQLGHMQICTSLQTDNHASTPLLGFYRPSILINFCTTHSRLYQNIYFILDFFVFIFALSAFAFSALTRLGIRNSIWLVKIE